MDSSKGGSPGVAASAQRLRVDYATAQVLRAFDAVGVASILLKGASIARWLYDAEASRAYVDCDLLVRPADLEAASSVLRGLGFVPEVDEEAMPAWWREHGLAWTRSHDGTSVDLHRNLPGVQVDADRLWETLSAKTEPVRVGDVSARALTLPGRALHVALHAAQHGESPAQLADLEQALQRADDATWREAAELAEVLGATDAFATGLRLVPSGEARASHLGLPSRRPVDVALRASDAPPEALTVERLSRARGVRARLAILRHKLAPPPTFMRKWSPLARRGRLGLAAAYVRRPLWVLRRTPTAVRAWLKARR